MHPVYNHSVLQVMQERGIADGFAVTTSLGCSNTCNTSMGFADAVTTATAADVVVLVVGLYPGGHNTIPDGGPVQVRPAALH